MFFIPAKESISVSVRRGLPSTAVQMSRFGSRMRMARSSRLPLSARMTFCAVVMPVDLLDRAHLLGFALLVLRQVALDGLVLGQRVPGSGSGSGSGAGGTGGGWGAATAEAAGRRSARRS